MPTGMFGGLAGLFGVSEERTGGGQAQQQQNAIVGIGAQMTTGAQVTIDDVVTADYIQTAMRARQGIARGMYHQMWGVNPELPRLPGEDIYNELSTLDPGLISEVIISGINFKLLAARLNVTDHDPKRGIRLSTYKSRPNETILVRNADHVLNLDDFIEDDIECKT